MAALSTGIVRDLREAERVAGDLFVPHRIEPQGGSGEVRMELSAAQLGQFTAGRLSYGQTIDMTTAELVDFHVDVPLRGSVVMGPVGRPAAEVRPGQAAVFDPGTPARLRWSADAVVLCLMVSRARVEDELETVLGRSLRVPLSFEFGLDPRRGPGRAWRPLVRLAAEEVTRPTGLGDLPGAARHLEALLLEGLLHAQPHNHTDLMARGAARGSLSAVARAARLLRERPTEPWTTARLAAEVHLSVRALQEGFRRDLDRSPMAYLREVRLREARAALRAGDPGTTTVLAVATQHGFLHPGRFAAVYAETFGERPATTLRRGSNEPD